MAQTVDLYVDTAQGKAVRSNSDPTIVPLPRFVQGDSFGLNIYLLKQNKSFPLAPAGSDPYSIILNNNLSCKVAIGVKDGLPGSLLYTQQFTWDKSSDNTYFTGTFPMNTDAIATLLGSNPSAQAWFEIEITDSGLPWTVLQELIRIEAEVIDTSVIQVPVGLTAISAEEANATFLKRQIVGAMYFQDVNNPGQYIAVFNENGTLVWRNVQGVLPQ